jgi:hypothetical protein
MAQTLSPLVIRLASASLLLGVGWLILLLFVRGGDLADLFLAGLADPGAVARLTGKGLSTPWPLYVTVLTLAVEIALAGILITAGVGLLRGWPPARWVALFGCVGSVVVEGGSTLLHVFCLTPSEAAVKLGPVVVNGLVVLTAIVLWGGLFLPEPALPPAGAPGETAGGAAQG